MVPALSLFAILIASGSMVAALGRDGIVAHLHWLLELVGEDMDKFMRIASNDSAMARLDEAEFWAGLPRALALFNDSMNTLATSLLNLSTHVTNDEFIGKLEAIMVRATHIQNPARGLAVVKYICNAGRVYLTNERLDAVIVKLNGSDPQVKLDKVKGTSAHSLPSAASFLA